MSAALASAGKLPQQVLVTGLVRNCAAGIRTDLQRLQAALRAFPQRHWLLVESDSADDSVATLQALCHEHENFRFLSLGALRERLPLRTDRLAHCRNAYLDELQGNPLYRDVELVVVSDFDGVNTHITEAGVMSCWQRGGWAMCAANQAGPYYDIWALRHPLWSPNDCFAMQRFLHRHGLSDERALQVAVLGRMVTLPPTANWLEVDSAFGGLALYQRAALEGVRYHGLDDEGAEVCEHVALHAAMRARQHRLFINPAMVNAGIAEHAEHLRLSRQLQRVAKAGARRLLGSLKGGAA